MNITYKRATLEDLDMLTKTRIEVLRAADKFSDNIDMSEIERQSQFLSGNADLSQSEWKEGLHNEYVYETGVQKKRHCL